MVTVAKGSRGIVLGGSRGCGAEAPDRHIVRASNPLAAIPRSGLDTDHDPYLDTYGRNCLSTTKTPLTADYLSAVTGDGPFPDYAGGNTAYKINESAIKNTHYWGYGDIVHPLGARITRQIVLKSDGVRYVAFMFRLTGNTGGWAHAIFDLTVGAVDSVFQGDTGLTAGIESLGDGWYRATISGTVGAAETNMYFGFNFLDDSKESSYLGNTDRGIYLSHMANWLSPTPFPYSAPAGAPGTLQAVIDRSGNAQNDQIGSTAGTDANDLPFNGWGLLNAGTGALYAKGTTRNLLDDWSILTVIDTQGVNSAGYGHIFDCGRYRAYIEGSDPYNLYVRGACATTDEIFAAYNVIPAGKSVIVVTSDGSVSENGKIRAWVNGVEVVMRCIQAGSGARTADGPLYYLNKSDGASPFKGVGGRRIRASRTWSPSEAVRASLYLVSLMAARNVCAASAFTHSALKMPSCLARAESDYDPYMDTFGRNVLPVGGEVVTVASGKWYAEKLTCVAGVLRESADTGIRYLYSSSSISALVRSVFQIEIKPDGRDAVLVMPRASSYGYGAVRVNLLTGGCVLQATPGAYGTIHGYGATVLSDGYVRCWIDSTIANDANSCGIRSCLDDGTYSYEGDITKGYLLRNPQLNLGPTLWPYAAPSGAPGTLQSVRDRAGAVGQNLIVASEGMDVPLASGGKWEYSSATVEKTAETIGGRPVFLQTTTATNNNVFLDEVRSGLTCQKGKRYTIDVYAKKGTGILLHVGFWPDAWGNRLALTVNLETGLPTGAVEMIEAYWANPSYSIQDAGGGYWHVVLSGDYINDTAYATTVTFRPFNTIGTIYASAPQVYEDGEPKAYVRTYDKPYVDGWHDMVGSTAGTDANDVPFNGWGNTFPGTGALYLKGDSRPLGDEWTMFVVAKIGVPTAGASEGNRLFSNGRWEVYAYGISNKQLVVREIGVGGTGSIYSASPQPSFAADDIAVLAIKTTGAIPRLWKNGVELALTTAGDFVSKGAEGAHYWGNRAAGDRCFNGTLGRRIVVPEAMTDAEIEEISAHLVALQAARGYPVTA